MSQKCQMNFEACCMGQLFYNTTIRCSYLTGFHFHIATLMTRLQKRQQHMKWKFGRFDISYSQKCGGFHFKYIHSFLKMIFNDK